MKFGLALLICLFLAGCATTQQQSQSGPYRKTVEQRLALLAAQNQWKLEGRIAVRNGEQGFSAGMHWQQAEERFDIRLLDPLGRRVAWLTGTADLVTLVTSDGQSYEGVDPQMLLRQHLGWGIPLDSLVYWVKGMPDPNKPSWREEYDDIGRPILLEQAEWTVNLSRYESGSVMAMPGLVKLERENFRAKLLVDSRE